jgi:hypothetical protein
LNYIFYQKKKVKKYLIFIKFQFLSNKSKISFDQNEKKSSSYLEREEKSLQFIPQYDAKSFDDNQREELFSVYKKIDCITKSLCSIKILKN